MKWRIPVAEPCLGEEEKKAVTDVVESGRISQGDRTREFEATIAKYVGRKYGVACHSGTCANEAMLMAVLQPSADDMTGLFQGKYVAFPTCSSVAVSNPALYCRAKPEFIDLDRKLCMDIEQLEALPGAIGLVAAMHVHAYGSYPEHWDLAQQSKIPMLEDTCVALGSEYEGRKLGSFGLASSLSFYVNKLITASEGGMVVTDDEQFAKYCWEYVNHGRTQSTMHESWYYNHIGRNAKMTDLQAAIGLAQFQKIQKFIDARKKIGQTLYNSLKDDPRFSTFTPSAGEVPWTFWVVNWDGTVNMAKASDRLQREFNIETRPTLPVLPKLPFYNYPGTWPVGEASQNGFIVSCSPAILEHDDLDYLKESLVNCLTT